MPKGYECTKCEVEFKTLKDYLNPYKHPCVKGKKPTEVPKPREKKS